MSHGEIKPNEWYLCLPCHSCRMEIPIMESGAVLEENIIEDTWFDQVECYYCGSRHDYCSGELKRLQARAWEVGLA